MEVPESPVMGVANILSTTESAKSKKKKSQKAKPTEDRPSTAPNNGIASSPSPEGDESRPSKRKRDFESHKKKNNKKRREGEDDANGESAPQDTIQMSDEEVPQTPSKLVSLLQGSPEPTSDATPGDEKRRKVRGYRIGGKNQQKVGFFVEDEVKALENFKVQFCNNQGVEGRTFDTMIQHSERGGDEWPVGTHICTKADFWNDIYDLIPDRDRRSVYRFMRRHFQNTTQKAHDWTPEQDEELITLHAQHGPKYAHIAKLLGRSDDDVTQRWKNRLQHRNTKRTGAWSEAELRAFVRSLEEYRNLLVTSSAEPEKAGKDIWEMDLKSISWGSISNGMDNSRTRQQCADKWRKISKSIMALRHTTNPNATFDPVEAAKKHHRWNGAPGNEKSNAYVEDADEDDDDDDETRIPSTTPVIVPKLEFATEQLAVDLAQVAREASAESSPSRGDIQVDGSYSVEQTKKRKHADAEESDDDEDEDDDAAAPSSPISENSHGEVKESREDKQERKRKKKERKERKRREAAEAAEVIEEDAPITPKDKKKHKKHRKSEANGNGVNEGETTESTKKKNKKEKRKHKKAVQHGDAGVDYTSDIEGSMVV